MKKVWIALLLCISLGIQCFAVTMPEVTAPCAALADAESGRIAIYYGAADTSVALAFTTVDETVNYIMANDLIK